MLYFKKLSNCITTEVNTAQNCVYKFNQNRLKTDYPYDLW
jgi:hypothetical protein